MCLLGAANGASPTAAAADRPHVAAAAAAADFGGGDRLAAVVGRLRVVASARGQQRRGPSAATDATDAADTASALLEAYEHGVARAECEVQIQFNLLENWYQNPP